MSDKAQKPDKQPAWLSEGVVLPPPCRVHLVEIFFHGDDRLVQLLRRGDDRLGAVIVPKIVLERIDLAPDDFGLIDDPHHAVDDIANLKQEACLSLDILLGSNGMWILDHHEIPAGFLSVDRERHGVVAGRRHDGRTSRCPAGDRSPAFRAQLDPRRDERAGSQSGLVGQVVPEIPPDPVDSVIPRTIEGPYCLALLIHDADGDRLRPISPQVIVDGSSVRRVIPDARIPSLGYGRLDRLESISRPQIEEMHVRRENFRRELLKRRDVVKDPEAAAVRPQHQVVEMLLDNHPVYGRVGQVRVQEEPGGAVVERDEQGVVGSQVEQAFTHRVLLYDAGIDAEGVARGERGGQVLPALAVVAGLVDKGIADVLLVEVDRDVGGARTVPRRFDVADNSPRWQIGNVGGDVGPVRAAIQGDMHEPVVRTGPDHALLQRRFGDGKDDAVLRARVHGRQAGHALQSADVTGGKVRADGLPAMSGVDGHVHILAADVNPIVVMGRNHEGKGSVEPIPEVDIRPAPGVVRPHADFALLAGAQIVDIQRAAGMAGGPDDVVVHGIGHGNAGFGASDGMPFASGDSPAPSDRRAAVARAAV